MNYELPLEIDTDYIQADLHVNHVTVTNIFEDMLYLMCTIHTDNGTYTGVCYWYAGENKNIPFTLPTIKKSK